jgi:hypothetical protein
MGARDAKRHAANFDHCPDEKKDLAPSDVLLKRYWTGDPTWQAGTTYDIFKFNPWRAPGKAPVFDSCGMAGGRWTEAFNAAAFNTTQYATMGDLGSKVLKPRPTGATWKRGGTALARWQITANHGGGYIYRLCPASEGLTEECFQKAELKWATQTSVLRFANSSDDVAIAATDVTEGGGVGWRLNPFPNVRSDPCDYKYVCLRRRWCFAALAPGGPPAAARCSSPAGGCALCRSAVLSAALPCPLPPCRALCRSAATRSRPRACIKPRELP